jgi:hypothetical protein
LDSEFFLVWRVFLELLKPLSSRHLMWAVDLPTIESTCM